MHSKETARSDKATIFARKTDLYGRKNNFRSMNMLKCGSSRESRFSGMVFDRGSSAGDDHTEAGCVVLVEMV